MTIIRFMSKEEAVKLMAGQKLHNTRDHKSAGAYSGSKGFCFMLVDGRKRGRIFHTAQYMSGIANFEACLIATIPHGKFEKSWGIYADYDVEEQFLWPKITRPELCTTSYSLYDFQHWAFYEGTGDPPFGSFKYETVKRVKCKCDNYPCNKEKFL